MTKRKKYITAFTLFETMVVLAIMGVLITIISISLNRFGEQLKVSNSIQQELNSWYCFRANLWRELYQADSMKLETEQLRIYNNQSFIDYKIEEDSLKRKTTQAEWKSTGFLANTIRTKEKGDDQLYHIEFVWKDDVMTLSYLDHQLPKIKIDRYFEKL